MDGNAQAAMTNLKSIQMNQAKDFFFFVFTCFLLVYKEHRSKQSWRTFIEQGFPCGPKF